MLQHHIGLIAGLTSSVNWDDNRFSSWARKLHGRFAVHYAGRQDVHVCSMSSDGNGEADFFERIELHLELGILGGVYGAGHSNGSRDWLRRARRHRNVEIGYLGLIDMALLARLFGAFAPPNVLQIDEFHGVLGYVAKLPEFTRRKRVHRLYETKVGHTASADLQWVQDHIFREITARIP